MPVAPIPTNYSYERLGTPWATREVKFHAQPGSPSPVAVPVELRGQMSGTPAYDAGFTPRGGTLPLPAPYDWNGESPVPNEFYAMMVDLASAFGSGIPAQTDVHGFLDFVRYTYQALITKGEGCGLDPDDLERIIIKHAGEGPHAVAYYLQEAALASDVCAKYLIKRPLDPPTRTMAPPVQDKPPGTFVIPPKTVAPPKKPFPWGWTIGGVSAAIAVGVGMYFLYKANKPKRRKNPSSCSCGNPAMAIVAVEDEEPLENPYSGTRAYSSIDGQVLGQTISPLLRNPGTRRRKGRRARR